MSRQTVQNINFLSRQAWLDMVRLLKNMRWFHTFNCWNAVLECGLWQPCGLQLHHHPLHLPVCKSVHKLDVILSFFCGNLCCSHVATMYNWHRQYPCAEYRVGKAGINVKWSDWKTNVIYIVMCTNTNYKSSFSPPPVMNSSTVWLKFAHTHTHTPTNPSTWHHFHILKVRAPFQGFWLHFLQQSICDSRARGMFFSSLCNLLLSCACCQRPRLKRFDASLHSSIEKKQHCGNNGWEICEQAVITAIIIIRITAFDFQPSAAHAAAPSLCLCAGTMEVFHSSPPSWTLTLNLSQ